MDLYCPMDAIASIGKMRPMDAMTQNTENRALTDKFMLRLPDGMRDRIKEVAAENNRSMNAEIVATLEDTYPSLDPSRYWDQLTARSDELLREMDEIIASYKDQSNNPDDLAARFAEIRKEHSEMFAAYLTPDAE